MGVKKAPESRTAGPFASRALAEAPNTSSSRVRRSHTMASPSRKYSTRCQGSSPFGTNAVNGISLGSGSRAS